MTLVEVRHNGRVLGRCDAKCYDAPGPSARCNCVCEGLNHGVGLEAATGNIARIVEEWRAYSGNYLAAGAPVQLRLFD